MPVGDEARLNATVADGFYGVLNSILFDWPMSGADGDQPTEPACLADLHLDQVLRSMTAGREEYHLEPFFSTPLRDVTAVRYRHEILRDLEKTQVLEAVEAFAEKLRAMRKHLAQASKLHYRRSYARRRTSTTRSPRTSA